MLTVTHRDAEGREQRRVLDRPTTIVGRRSSCDIVLTERNVSRQHAALRLRDGELTVQDLDSFNGLTVNDEPVRGKTTLKIGDVLRIGDVLLTVGEEVEPGAEVEATTLETSDDDGAPLDADDAADPVASARTALLPALPTSRGWRLGASPRTALAVFVLLCLLTAAAWWLAAR